MQPNATCGREMIDIRGKITKNSHGTGIPTSTANFVFEIQISLTAAQISNTYFGHIESKSWHFECLEVSNILPAYSSTSYRHSKCQDFGSIWPKYVVEI